MINLDFVQVPVSALMNIKDTSIKVYSIIYTSCRLNNNTFYHSYSQFATDLGVDIQYVKRALKDLKDGGFIEIESGKGAKKPNTYHIIDDTSNRVKSEPINRVKFEPQKRIYINKGNNNNYNNSTSRYMEPLNENSKKYVKTELVSIPNNDNLTDGTLNYICSRDGLVEDAIGTIPTAQGTTSLKTLREADEWEYRQLKDSCWKHTMDKEVTRLGKTPTETEMRTLCNSIYKDWETRNEAKNKRTLNEMIQYAFTRYGITLQPRKKKQSNFGKPTHNTNRPTTTEINNMSFVNITQNVDALERLELASKDCMVFIDAMNKCIEYLQITKRPTISVCKVWFNALHVIQTDGDRMNDKTFNYGCDVMDALEKAIYDCGGQGLMQTLQNGEYSHLFKAA